jgi:hypothetical protein
MVRPGWTRSALYITWSMELPPDRPGRRCRLIAKLQGSGGGDLHDPAACAGPGKVLAAVGGIHLPPADEVDRGGGGKESEAVLRAQQD